MNKKISISELINQYKATEGESFSINEQAIITETVEQAANKTTLTITILSILGGFFATLTFLGFLLLTGLYNSEESLLAFGLLFIIASVWLNKVYNKTIIDTISVTAYLTGFCMVGFSLEEFQANENAVFLIFIAIASMSIVIHQTYILSLLSFLIILGSIFGLINMHDTIAIFPYIYIAVLVFIVSMLALNESRIISFNSKILKLYQPLFLAFTVALITVLGFSTVIDSYMLEVKNNYSWIGSVASIMMVLFTISKIKKWHESESSTLQNVITYAGTVIVLAPTIYSPAIAGGLLIILLSYLLNNKVTLVIGILSFIYSISLYYYNLEYTLLYKSIILVVSGLLFLFAYIIYINKVKSHEKI